MLAQTLPELIRPRPSPACLGYRCALRAHLGEISGANGESYAYASLGMGLRGAVAMPVWDSVTLLRDPYSGAAEGQVALTASGMWNFKILRASATWLNSEWRRPSMSEFRFLQSPGLETRADGTLSGVVLRYGDDGHCNGSQWRNCAGDDYAWVLLATWARLTWFWTAPTGASCPWQEPKAAALNFETARTL